MVVSFIIHRKKGNKIVFTLVKDSGMFGSDSKLELTPKELLNLIDELDVKENTILSNEPLLLEALLYNRDEKPLYTKQRLSQIESILEWWLE